MDPIRIEDLIPHRPPMLLVDEIVELDSLTKNIVARKTIRRDEYFLQGHYPDFPIVPGVISCECIFQAGAALLAYILKDLPKRRRTDLPVIAKINSAKFLEVIRPGDEVILRVEVYDQVGPAYFLKGSASVLEKIRVKVDFVCMSKTLEIDDE